MLANLEKQSFAEAWGKLAKDTFPDALLDTFSDPKLKTLIKKIDVLGPANLPTEERERVSLYSIYNITCYNITGCILPKHDTVTFL